MSLIPGSLIQITSDVFPMYTWNEKVDVTIFNESYRNYSSAQTVRNTFALVISDKIEKHTMFRGAITHVFYDGMIRFFVSEDASMGRNFIVLCGV